MKAARRRELRARWMLEQGHKMTARESFFTAAALYRRSGPATPTPSWPWGEHRTHECGIIENLKRRVFAER